VLLLPCCEKVGKYLTVAFISLLVDSNSKISTLRDQVIVNQMPQSHSFGMSPNMYPVFRKLGRGRGGGGGGVRRRKYLILVAVTS
jgi:hypothetical protein